MERLTKSNMIGTNMVSASQKWVNSDCPVHFHDFYELEYVLRGSGSCTINGKTERCAPGMLFFLTPVDSHSLQTDGIELINIMFSEQLVDFRLLEPFLRYAAPRFVAVEPQVRPFVEQLCTEVVQYEGNEEYVTVLMQCLLLKIAQSLPGTRDISPGTLMSRLHAYLLSHYRQRITLESAADYVGLTPGYVSVLFKKEMGIGFKAYLNSLRMEYAKKLLVSTQQGIRQICEESGFEDVPNFTRRFKSYHGMTPSQLRSSWADTQAQRRESTTMMIYMEQAKQLLQSGGYTCVLTDGAYLYTSEQRGVKPLVQLLEQKNAPTGLSAADKVVGKATAWLYILLKIRELYALVISEPALHLLEKHGISVTYEQKVSHIVNRAGDGMCPFEEAVLDTEDPQRAYGKIREKMREMKIAL